MRGFRRAQLRGSDELFRPSEPEQTEVPLAPGLGNDHPGVRPVPASPAPDMRSVRLTADQIRTLADAIQHLKFPQKQPNRPSIGDFESLEQLRQTLLDAL